MMSTEILEQQTQSTIILKKTKKIPNVGQRWLVKSLAFMEQGKYTQAFPEQKKSSNPGVELCNALKIQVVLG